MKTCKAYRGPFVKDEAERYRDYFINVSKEPFLEYKGEKLENGFKGAFIRKRAKTNLYDVFIKIDDAFY